MVNIISQTEYQRIWQQVNHNTQYPEASNTADFINYYLEHFGRGYRGWMQLHGINLLIIDKEFYHDLYIESDRLNMAW
ncbi:MAG: hypothetical protein AB3A66_10910 [Nodularia sp. CChRGM 3473]